MTNWHTVMVQMHLFYQRSGDYIKDETCFCYSMYILPYDLTFVCYFHIINLYKQTMNKTKYLVPLLLTFNNQGKSIYVHKSIGHFSPLMLLLAVCQLNTSYWVAAETLVLGLDIPKWALLDNTNNLAEICFKNFSQPCSMWWPKMAQRPNVTFFIAWVCTRLVAAPYLG